MGNLQSQSQPRVNLKQAARFARDATPSNGRYIYDQFSEVLDITGVTVDLVLATKSLTRHMQFDKQVLFGYNI